jgi:hypothetical protein
VFPMTAVADALFAVRAPGTQSWAPLSFYEVPGSGAYLHFGARATPKVS